MALALDKMLGDLGGTAEEVAVSLDSRGIKGVRNAARQLNIVVRYVQSRLTDDVVSVDLLRPSSLQVSFAPSRPAEEETLPKAVIEFLDAFDGGAYPRATSFQFARLLGNQGGCGQRDDIAT